MKKILIAGGGASGMMAAIAAARSGASVTLIEANDRPGRKLCAAGNGRCNLSNLGDSSTAYRGSEPAFAEKVLSAFPAEETLKIFSELGLPTQSQNGWIYPVSEDSRSVLLALTMALEKLKVKVKTNEKILSAGKQDGNFFVKTEGWTYSGDALILACGSPASGVRGSSDISYRIARSFGHSIVEPLPALVPLLSCDKRLASWGSYRLRGSVSLSIDGREVIRRSGRLQTIDRGISGIPVLQVSRFASRALAEGKKVTAELDLFPDMNDEEAAVFFKKSELRGLSLQQTLSLILPGKTAEAFLRGKASFADMGREVKHFNFTVSKTASMEVAQIMCGGVSTEAIDPFTLESRFTPGLYLTGELLDIDGDCGGWNLQFAWSTGYLAGQAAAKENGGSYASDNRY